MVSDADVDGATTVSAELGLASLLGKSNCVEQHFVSITIRKLMLIGFVISQKPAQKECCSLESSAEPPHAKSHHGGFESALLPTHLN